MSALTLVSKKYGTEKIDIDQFDPERASVNSTFFKVVEHVFNDWYEHNTQPGAPLNKDIKFIYNGCADEPTVFSRKGAIREGIRILIDEAVEYGKQRITTKDVLMMDIEAAFI